MKEYLFILRAVKSKNDDPFGLFPNDDYIYFFCKGLKDLRDTIRHITPMGYRVRTTAWFSKHLKLHNYDLILYNRFLFERETYRILKIDAMPNKLMTIDYENRSRKIYPLKVIDSITELEGIKNKFK